MSTCHDVIDHVIGVRFPEAVYLPGGKSSPLIMFVLPPREATSDACSSETCESELLRQVVVVNTREMTLVSSFLVAASARLQSSDGEGGALSAVELTLRPAEMDTGTGEVECCKLFAMMKIQGRPLRRLGGPVEWLTAAAADTLSASLGPGEGIPDWQMCTMGAGGGKATPTSFSYRWLVGSAENEGQDRSAELFWDVLEIAEPEMDRRDERYFVVAGGNQRLGASESHELVAFDGFGRREQNFRGEAVYSAMLQLLKAREQVVTVQFADCGARVTGSGPMSLFFHDGDGDSAEGTDNEATLYLARRRRQHDALVDKCPPSNLLSADWPGLLEYINPSPPQFLHAIRWPGVPPRNVVFVLGAGISVAAGIPDYRTPGTGLYHTLQKYNLPSPESVFTLSYLRDHPEAFFDVERSLPDMSKVAPTIAHKLMKAVSDSGRLLRIYTQNVDGLEYRVGIPADKIVAAHGNSFGAHCIDCKAAMPVDEYNDTVHVKKAIPRCAACSGIVKADFVLYGEPMPDRFFILAEEDLPKCDLLVVMGTSLVVQPFCNLATMVEGWCPRVVINRERVGQDLGIRLSDDGDAAESRDIFLGGDLQLHCERLIESFTGTK